MDEELDLVVIEDDDGNELTLEVIDYINYEGKEYAFLTEYVEEPENSDDVREAFVMEVRPIEDDDENEEFVPVDEELAQTLIDFYRNFDVDEDEEYDEDPVE